MMATEETKETKVISAVDLPENKKVKATRAKKK
jgi:hypothetical protein